MAQQRDGMTIPAGGGGSPAGYSYSGQAGGGTGSVFGDLGGPGQQQGGGGDVLDLDVSAGPRNIYGHPTGNPSGDTDSVPDIADAPPLGSVFGDLGGSGVAREEMGAAIPAAPVGSDPQGGR